MATNSAYNEIKRKITSSKRGTLFFPDSFAQMASSDAIRSALVRLCKDGDIIRVAQGIYCYPKIDTKWGSGVVPPSIEDISNGIAKRDKVRIVPTGAYVLNVLGLSKQVPANVVFFTDGSSRKVVWVVFKYNRNNVVVTPQLPHSYPTVNESNYCNKR